MTWVWLLWSELPPGKDRPGRRPTGRIAGPSRHLLLGCRVPGAGRSLGPARCDTGPVGTGPMWHRTGYGAVSRPALTPQEPHPCDIAVVADEARCGLLRRKLLVGLQAETGRAYPGS